MGTHDCDTHFLAPDSSYMPRFEEVRGYFLHIIPRFDMVRLVSPTVYPAYLQDRLLLLFTLRFRRRRCCTLRSPDDSISWVTGRSRIHVVSLEDMFLSCGRSGVVSQQLLSRDHLDKNDEEGEQHRTRALVIQTRNRYGSTPLQKWQPKSIWLR